MHFMHSLCSIVMVTRKTSHDPSISNGIIYPMIKPIDKPRNGTISGVMIFRSTAFVFPAPVFRIVIMVTEHTTKKFIGWAMLHNWLIKPVHIIWCPVTFIKIDVSYTTALPPPPAIFPTIIMFTDYSIKPMLIRAFNTKV